MRLLVVVDMQEDFIRGALTVPGAEVSGRFSSSLISLASVNQTWSFMSCEPILTICSPVTLAMSLISVGAAASQRALRYGVRDYLDGTDPGNAVLDRKSTRLNSSHSRAPRMPSSA